MDIFLVDPANPRHETVLAARRFSDNSPAFSPDGKRVVFIAHSDGNAEIRVVPFEGGSTTTLSGIRFLGTNYPFDVSRDGRFLATSNTVSVSNELWLLGRGASSAPSR